MGEAMGVEQKLEPEDGIDVGTRVRGAVLWRSGSQIAAQLVTWAATFLVIRLLDPADYGLMAMSQVVLVFLNLMNGHGFASGLVQSERIDRRRIAQVFGMLLLLNGALAAVQIGLAPLAAAYFRQPLLVQMLRVQALIYVATPFIAVPSALLGRTLEFRRQALVNLAAATLSAATALTMASAGFGVWTLVAAPIVLFWARAVGLTLACRWLVLPSFRFEGAGRLFGFGAALILVQLFWFVQSQADVFFAGRAFDAGTLGLYTTALFLAQILAAKFVPPLNEVAFAAYSRIQGDGAALAKAFLKATRLIMLAALPFYFGLAATAQPLVATFLGTKWAGIVPLVRILALAMPLMTLQILFAPATNALGRPIIAVRSGAAGAALLPAAFLVGLRFGPIGLAWAWVGGMAALLAATMALSLPAIGARAVEVAKAVAPGLAASAVMAAAVLALDASLPAMPDHVRLALLVSSGTAAYAALLFALARPAALELLALARRREAIA
jgi:O-antigen/teichoic acid export membrane protein